MDEPRGPRRMAGRLTSRLRRRDTRPAEPMPAPLPGPASRPSPDGAAQPPTDQPLVSVVVPVYAVERYVEDCLTSLLRQSYPHLEVVVVDDGSPDGSMDIVERYAAKDDRIRVVHQDNAGLGAARNRGIDEARGDLVTFVDSDDTLPENALAAHVRTLVRTGSDFSVGALERQQSESTYIQKPWSRRLHEVARRAVTIDDVPEAMANVFACTKVFRRAFLEEIGLRFPVGVRYEDQVPITRAYLRARSFDILPDVVYRWRARRDGSSITQQKARKDDLHDRLLAVDEVARMVRARGSEAVLQGWYGKVFEFDLFAYIRAAVDADDTYYGTLAETVAHVLDGAPAEAWTRVDLRHRIAAWALVHEGRATLTRLLESPLLTGNVPVRLRGEALEADSAALGLHGDVPPELLAVTDKDLLVEARLDGLAFDGDDLVVRGVGFTRYVDSSLPHEVTLTLQRRAGGAPVTVATRREHVEDANVFADRHHEDHRDDGFVARVPVADLVAASDGARTTWLSRVACTSLGGTRTAVFRERVDHGSTLRSHARLVVGDVLVETSWSDRLGLVVTVRRDWVALVGTEPGGGLLLRAAPGVTPRTLLLQRDEVGEVTPVDASSGSYCARLATPDASEVAEPALPRRLTVDVDEGKPQPLVALGVDGPLVLPGDDRLLLADDGVARIAVRRAHLRTERLSVDGAVARLAGSFTGTPPDSLTLLGPRATTSGPVTVEGGDRWRAELPVTRPSLLDGSPLPLPRDVYDVSGGDGVTVVGVPALDAADAVRDRPEEWAARLRDGGALAVERSRGSEVETHTRHGQQVVQGSFYAAGRRSGRRPLVLVDSFVGRGLFHAAGAVVRSLRAQRPDLEVVWALRDESLPPPPGTTPVSRQSAEWFEHLAAASHVVTNQTMPRFYEKPPGQRLVQLWTGTPVLRFGYAVPPGEEGHGSEVRALARDAAGWDVLYTGSALATAWMREATGFAGEAREVGHPALDAYRADDREARAAAVRSRLGIGNGPVLLYAPTTRRAVRAHTRREKVLDLDAPALHAAVPGLTVLHRGHPNTANRQLLGHESGMLDVTLYPELSDLVLAADAVVSDYSSLLVDVLASGKPLALFVPDLVDFEEVGFFPELFADPPGPVVTSTEELVPWLAAPGSTPYPGRERLQEQLLPLDDGRAAERIVAAEWG